MTTMIYTHMLKASGYTAESFIFLPKTDLLQTATTWIEIC